MALSDLLDLRSAVVDFIGDTSIAEVFPRLVKMAETEMNRRLRCREQIAESSLSVSSGSASLPSDFEEVVGLFTTAGKEYIALPVAAYEKLNSKIGFFTIEGSSLYAADAAYTLKYYQSLTTVTGSMTDSNWVLAKHPNLYLYAVAYEAARFLRNPELTAAALQFREAEFQAARSRDDSERYSRARVRVGGVTP